MFRVVYIKDEDNLREATIEIDCVKARTLEGLCSEFNRILNVGHDFTNLNALEEVLEDIEVYIDIGDIDSIDIRFENADELFKDEKQSSVAYLLHVLYGVSEFWTRKIGYDNCPKKILTMKFTFDVV